MEIFLNEQASVDKVLEILEDQNVLAIDIEFQRKNTYFAKPCIMQIAAGDKAYILDLQLELNLNKLKDIICDPAKLKILHAPRQDMEILYRMFKVVPNNFFDTQLAGAILKIAESPSYEMLCDKILNVKIDKLHQNGNWTVRPLTNEQLLYAINDVLYLEKLYNHLHSRLIDENKYARYKERLEYELSLERILPNINCAWKKVKYSRAVKVSIPNLQVLAAFREETAIALNIPRGHFICDDDLVKLCTALPRNKNELQNLNIYSKYVGKYGAKIIEICLGLRELYHAL